jgi:hypothetical protein
VAVHAHLLSKGAGSLAQFTEDPLLSMAAILLIVVSVGWIVTSRLIRAELKKAAIRKQRKSRRPPPPPKRRSDVWREPPS